jgi:hypothetical protein
MTAAEGPLLEQALQRLSAALDRLELAATARLDAEQALEPLETELAIMRDDRARLAVELDGALARNASLEHATGEVSQRVARAMGSIEAVLRGASEVPSEPRSKGS